MASTRVLPDSVMLQMPEYWSDLPMDAEGFRQYRADLIRQVGAQEGVTRYDQRVLETFLANLYQLAESQRILFASGLFQYLEEPDKEELVPMIASAMVSLVLREDLGVDVPLYPEVLVQAFSQDRGEADSSIRFDHIEPPVAVMIGNNEAARLLRMMRIDRPGKEQHSQFTQTYLVPVAEGDAVVILQFGTLSLDYAREFSNLFNQIAQSLVVLYPDDPTPMVDPESGSEQPDQ